VVATVLFTHMATAYLTELLDVTDAELEAMLPADRAWYETELTRELTLRSPADFAVANSDGDWLPYHHLTFTSDAIVSMIEDDDCDCLIIDQPIRHGKSELLSKWMPAWFLTRFPRKRVLLASYEADFAATWGRKVRDIIDAIGAKYGVFLAPGSKAAARWDMANGKGGMGTAGSNGPIIGKGGDVLIIDDPTKNFDEANSLVYREKLWDWWQNVWLGRREPNAKLIIIMSRWHQDDLIGRLLKQDSGMRIKRLRMPVIAEEDDILGRPVGAALCPERFDEETLAQTRKDVGPTAWASQYMQRPTTRGGGMFKPADEFQYFSTETIGETTVYEFGDELIDGDQCSRFSTLDVAFTKAKTSDYTAMATCMVVPGDPVRLAILHIERRRTTTAEHAPLIHDTWTTWGPSWVGIEKQSATLALFAEVQREGVLVRWLKPDKSKTARAETLAGLFRAGRVWIPRDALWISDFIDELAAFPRGTHDDQIDAVAYAAIELQSRHVHPRRAKKREQSEDERIWDRVMAGKTPSNVHPVLGRMR
jgi:predicted phage terminase large subunit-like protein